MGRLLVAGLLFLAVSPLGAAELRSPDGAIALTVDVNERGEPRYAVAYRGEPLVAPSRLGLRFARGVHLDAGFAIRGRPVPRTIAAGSSPGASGAWSSTGTRSWS